MIRVTVRTRIDLEGGKKEKTRFGHFGFWGKGVGFLSYVGIREIAKGKLASSGVSLVVY